MEFSLKQIEAIQVTFKRLSYLIVQWIHFVAVIILDCKRYSRLVSVVIGV